MTDAAASEQLARPPAHFPPLPSETYAVIYADPPWDYKGQLQHAGPGSADTGGAARHYPTLTLDGLKRLDRRFQEPASRLATLPPL